MKGRKTGNFSSGKRRGGICPDQSPGGEKGNWPPRKLYSGWWGREKEERGGVLTTAGHKRGGRYPFIGEGLRSRRKGRGKRKKQEFLIRAERSGDSGPISRGGTSPKRGLIRWAGESWTRKQEWQKGGGGNRAGMRRKEVSPEVRARGERGKTLFVRR